MVRLGTVARWLFFGAIIAYVAVPMVAVVLYSFSTRWTSHVLPDGYTIRHWGEALRDQQLQDALFRTTWLAVLVLLLDMAVVIPAVYWQRVRNPHIRVVVELSAAIPFVLPFIVIAFGVLQLVGNYRPDALGTWWLIWLAHAAIAFPFLYWAIDGSMAAINVVRLNEAAQMSGATPFQTLRYVVLPNIGAGIAAGGMLVFATSFGEFAIVQILAGARFENVSLYSLNLLTNTQAQYEKLAVLTVITFAFLFAISAGVVLLSRGQTTRMVPGGRSLSGKS
jgi:putative spermidine/putrescine transport system permease protein